MAVPSVTRHPVALQVVKQEDKWRS